MSKDISIEKGFEELENIAKSLEKGELTLEEMMELYNKGMEFTAVIKNKLENATLKIEEVYKKSNNNFTEETVE